MTGASSAVFGTPELLEEIPSKMCEVDDLDWYRRWNAMKDLLRCQRIDKTFSATINGSAKLQRLFFFRINAKTGESKSPYMQDHQSVTRKQWCSTANSLLDGKPIKIEIRDVDVVLDVGDRRDSRNGVHILFVIKNASRNRTATSANGSWRKMLLAQPPLPPLVYCSSYRKIDPPKLLHEVMKYEVGMTFGDVVDRFPSWESEREGGMDWTDYERI